LRRCGPAPYKLTFSLTGFGTVVREGVALPANFTATVNAEMKVGSLEETINVSGTSPQVDVQQATRTTTYRARRHRRAADFAQRHGLAVIVPGVRPGTPDMGRHPDDRAGRLRARGLGGLDGDQLVEGMSIQSYEGHVVELSRRHPAG
jgi:hypothetical protein